MQSSFSYFEHITRTLRQYYQRLRHLEEEELLIYIALPLSCIMLSATFFMKNDTEPRIKKPKNYRRQQRQLVEYRNLNKLNRSEIEKFCKIFFSHQTDNDNNHKVRLLMGHQK